MSLDAELDKLFGPDPGTEVGAKPMDGLLGDIGASIENAIADRTRDHVVTKAVEEMAHLLRGQQAQARGMLEAQVGLTTELKSTVEGFAASLVAMQAQIDSISKAVIAPRVREAERDERGRIVRVIDRLA